MSEDTNIVKFDPKRPKVSALEKKATKTSKPKDSPKYSEIRGEGFATVKEKKIALTTLMEKAREEVKIAHKELWAEIHRVVPEADENKNYALDAEYEELGFYVIKESKKGEMPEFLKALLNHLTD